MIFCQVLTPALNLAVKIGNDKEIGFSWRTIIANMVLNLMDAKSNGIRAHRFQLSE